MRVQWSLAGETAPPESRVEFAVRGRTAGSFEMLHGHCKLTMIAHNLLGPDATERNKPGLGSDDANAPPQHHNQIQN